MTKLFVYDGVKSVPIWDEGSPAWNNLSGSTNTTSQYKAIASIYRGINMVANDVARMPFIITRKGEVVDTSQDYKNVLDFLPSPRGLFKQLSTSLDTTGSAYALPIGNQAGYIKDLRYIAPSTITVEYDKINGQLKYLIRKINERDPIKYEPGKEMLYWWLPDEEVELGKPTIYPLKAAKTSADVLINLDLFIATYFKRGMIRPIIVSVDGDPPEQERERMESWFNSLWSGIQNAFRLKIFKAGLVKIQQVGDGLDQLQNQELSSEKKKDIALALGIPFAMLFSEAANFSTLEGDTKFYYTNTIEPRCELIAEGINSQLFSLNNRYSQYRLEFQPETLDIYQTDEKQRAEALNQYVNAGIPLLVACDLIGIELTEEQRAILEKEQTDPSSTQGSQERADQQQPDQNQPIMEELAKWRRKSLKAARSGKPAQVAFETSIIPRATQAIINAKLKTADSDQDVINIFAEFQPGYQEDGNDLTDAIIALTETLANAE